MNEIELPIGIRAFTEDPKKSKRKRRRPPKRWPLDALVLDFETSTDPAQRLSSGSYRHLRWTDDGTRLVCREEGLVYGDDLPELDPEGYARLEAYVESHQADVDPAVFGGRRRRRLRFRSRTEFVETVFCRVAHRAEALVSASTSPSISPAWPWT